MKRQVVLVMLFSAFSSIVFGQKAIVQSPNQKIVVEIFNKQSNNIGEWYIKAAYNNNGKITEAIPRIDVGLSRSCLRVRTVLKNLRS
jgi:alpha-glucosidase